MNFINKWRISQKVGTVCNTVIFFSIFSMLIVLILHNFKFFSGNTERQITLIRTTHYFFLFLSSFFSSSWDASSPSSGSGRGGGAIWGNTFSPWYASLPSNFSWFSICMSLLNCAILSPLTGAPILKNLAFIPTAYNINKHLLIIYDQFPHRTCQHFYLKMGNKHLPLILTQYLHALEIIMNALYIKIRKKVWSPLIQINSCPFFRKIKKYQIKFFFFILIIRNYNEVFVLCGMTCFSHDWNCGSSVCLTNLLRKLP